MICVVLIAHYVASFGLFWFGLLSWLEWIGVFRSNRVGWSQEKCKFEYTVKVVQTRGCGKCVENAQGSPRLGTNGTWLQLVRSCAFLLDSVSLISRVKQMRGVATGFPKRECAARSCEDSNGVNNYNIQTKELDLMCELKY